MENGWQMKCGLALPSSSAMLASPVTATHIQAQEMRNQMNMNTGHCTNPHDAREPRLLSPEQKSAPTISNMLNFGSCKSVHHEVENSFLPLLSAPPSFLQGDFSQQSNLKSSGGSYYPTNYAPSSAGKVPNWSIMPNNGNSNSTPAVDVHPYSQSRPTVINSKYRSHGLCDDLDALRALITGVGSRNENSGNASLQKAIYRAPSSSASGQISHGSESNMRREAFLQISSSVANKQTPVVRECPRVFCMVACGDLLLSNTGLLGIHCSCHGLHMSVSNFCEHSGLSDVNPGNAVRMESGESIAQWRKLYLQKFGIRAPEDHRGWDWPEGLLTTPGLAQNSTAVSSRGKVFDLSSLFTATAEPVKSAQHWNNVLISKPQPIYEYANELSKVERGNGCNQCSFLMSSTGVSRWNSHSTTDNPSKNCHLPSHLVTSRVSGRGGLRNDCQSRSIHSYIISGSENSSSFTFQNLQSVESKTDNNSEENIVVQRGTHSSRTDLKLGQSTQQGWGSGSTIPSAMRSNVRDMQKTTFQEQVTHNFGNSKVIKNCDQCLPWDLASDLHRNNKEFQLGPQSDACCSGNGASRMEHLKDGLVNSSVVSAPIIPCNTSAGDSSVHHMENNEDIRSYHFIPRTLHSQSHVDRSAVIDFSCDEGGGPISALDTNKLAFLKNKDFTMNAKCENNHSIVGSESSFRLYVKQMENSGFFSTNGNNRLFNSCTIPGQKFNSHQMPSMLTDISSASNYKDSVCSLGSNSGSDHINSSWGFGITQTLSTSSSSLTPVTVVLGPGLDPASLNKEVDYVNPHKSNESFRSLALRNADKSLAEKAVDASFRLNQRLRTDANKGQHSKDCSVSNSWVPGSFLDPGPSKEIHKHPFNLGHNAKSTFCPGSGCKKAGNIRKGTKEEGTNNWENVEVGCCRMVSNSGVTDRCFQGSCGCQPAKQPSLSLCRSENKANDCNMLQGCSEGSCTYFSGMSHCTVQTMYPNRESDSKGICIINNLKSQARTEVVGAPDLNGSKLVNDSVPVIKVTLGDCNRKLKEQLDDQLECVGSRWRDVPSKMNPVAQLRCPNVPDKSLEADFQVEEFGGNAISITDQVADLKGKESSNVSSGCSEAVVTEASVEVNKTGSYTVDGDDTGNTNDQIADQGSTIDRSWSSADAIDSSRSSQSIFCSEGKPTEEESLAVLPNAAIHCLNQEFKLKHSESKELQSLGDFGASFDKVCNTTLNQNNQTNFRKRKRRTKWRTLGTSLASESPMHASKCDADDNAYMFEDVQVLFQSNQDSANMIGADLEAHIVKRRSGMYSVKTSRKRDLCGMYNVVEDELDDHRPVKGNDDSLANPENVVSKRLKPVKHTESLVRQPKRTEVAKQFWSYDPNGYETSKYSVNCCQKASCVSDENVRIQKAKPVACGKYGILCNQELDLDQIKPPKIVPLSQVLKSSRRLAKFNNVHALPSLRDVDQLNGGCKCIYEFFGSSSDEGSECNNFLSCTGGDYTTNVNDTIKTSHTEDEIVASDLSVLGEVEASENKRNLIVASGSVTTKSKPKEIRVRSLYELSMRGKEFILTNVNLSQNLMCTPSTVCESKRKEFGYTEKNDDDQCRVGTSRYEGQPPFNSIVTELDALCCVCGISNTDDTNCLLECGHCLIRIHQACYGISRVPKGDWYCRPCRTSSKDVACVLCGYGGGAMTRAFGSRNIVKSLLKAWNIRSKSHILGFASSEGLYGPRKMECENKGGSARFHVSSEKLGINNSIISGLNDRTVKQWVHMVCGLWTPGARCPNVSTMSAFDVSGVSHPKLLKVCYICKRRGGSCISCRVVACNTYFHPWCAHQKGLLQREVEDVDNHKMSFYGKCLLHANHQTCAPESNDTCKNDSETERGKEPTCARTEGYKGKNQECEKHSSYQHTGKGRSLVSQVQLDAWLHINRRKLNVKRLLIPPVSDADHDYRIEYARYKQAKGWKQLVVFKSGIHALGLYTSLFIPHGAMVVEYIGETVGLRVADKREMEYLSGRRAQYKGACYFFKIDKEHIIDATCKGGIARFVNHSCQPNCVAKVITVRSEKKVVFFAQRDIYPGEEITYDYHFNNEDEGKKIPCFCNSKNCRRFLN